MPLVTVEQARTRLATIFPEVVPERAQLVRELAAKTVLTFLFVGAVGDPDDDAIPLVRPSMVTWMDDESLARTEDDAYVQGWHRAAARGQAPLQSLRDEHGVSAARWYADNSRESIRDEVIRPLNERYGAVLRRAGVPTTGATPALSLAPDFAALFDPELSPEAFGEAAAAWQRDHLDPIEQARLQAHRRLQGRDVVVVELPGRGDRHLPAGPSSVLTSAVITGFAPRALAEPYVLAICHSRDPVAVEDERELAQVGLALDAAVALPDVLLLDAHDRTLWFCEVVVSDGPIHERRRAELLGWATSRGIAPGQCRFVTAFLSRTEGVFRRLVGALAWDTLAWFADEPERIFRLEELRRD